MPNSLQQRALALHLWWRYTWRSVVFMMPVGLVVGILVAIMVPMSRALSSAVLIVGIPLMTTAALVAGAIIMGSIIRSKSFLKPFQQNGATLQPFAVFDGRPIEGPMPWSSAYGILWGIGWRSWLISLGLQIILHLTAQSHATGPMLMSIALGQVGVIVAFYWIIKAPMGKTRLEIADTASSTSTDMNSPTAKPLGRL